MDKMEQSDDEKVIDAIVDDWIKVFSNVPLIDVPHDILYKISRNFSPEDEWKRLAGGLGVHDIQTLKEISGDAYAERQWHSLVLLLYCAEHYPLTFSDLLIVLQKQLKRKDVLQRLHDCGCVEEFIRDRPQNNSTQSKYSDSRMLIAKCLQRIRKQQDSPKLDRFALDGPALDRLCEVVMALPNVQTDFEARLALETETSGLLQSQKRNKSRLDEKVQNNGCDKLNDLGRKDACDHVNIMRPPAKKRFAVLLTYAEDANDVVPAIHKRLWQHQIGVVSEYTLQGRGFLESDRIAAWQGFFQQCDMVIPIISNQYLRNIKSSSTSAQSQGVRFVYTLFTNHYVSRGCINEKVRPLVMDTLPRGKLQNIGPLLSINWKLDSEMDKFVNVLIHRKNAMEAQ